MSRRDSMIEMLIDDDLNTIFTMKGEENDESLIAQMLYSGFKGYENYTEEELITEMNERELWNEWFKETV
jgi:hypothetical protein